MEWVRESILSCSLAEGGGRRTRSLDRVVQHVHTMLVEGVAKP